MHKQNSLLQGWFRMLKDRTDAKQAKCSIRRLISYVRGANFM